MDCIPELILYKPNVTGLAIDCARNSAESAHEASQKLTISSCLDVRSGALTDRESVLERRALARCGDDVAEVGWSVRTRRS